MKEITVFSPASVANLGCGFDILGLALNQIGDKVHFKVRNDKKIVIHNETVFDMPLSPEKNIITIAIHSLFRELQESVGLDITIQEKIKPGSGLGSSGSSAAAGVFAVNEIFGRPFSKLQLTQFAMDGEKAISLKGHADNVGASVFGGLILVRNYHPLEIVEIDYPKNLWISIIYPQVEVKTSEAKKLLREYISLEDAITQWGNVAGLITGMMRSDYALIGRSLQDVVAEPVRSILIPEYHKMKKIAMDEGALGFNISGSGPSMFAFCKDEKTSVRITEKAKELYSNSHVEVITYFSTINKDGVQSI